MIISRNARTLERLKKIILKGSYDKDEFILDVNDFLELGTLTQEEYDELLKLIEENPPKTLRTTIDGSGTIISDNTYLLLKKQINRMVYSSDVIEQLVTDFKITGAITREQFKSLILLIEELYYPETEVEEIN